MHRLFNRHYHAPGAGFVGGAGYDPQVDAVGLGVDAEVGVFVAEILGHDFVHRRFAQAHGLDVAGDGDLLRHQLLQKGFDLFAEDGLHLHRRAGHDDDVLAVALGPPARGSAVAVGNELGRGDQPRLLDIVRRHILAPVAEILA